MRKFLAENQLEALSIPIANLKLHVTCFYKDRFLIFDYLDLCTAFVRHKETLVQMTFQRKTLPKSKFENLSRTNNKITTTYLDLYVLSK